MSRLRAFVDALALALPCDVCRQHFATRRGAAGGLDEAIAGGATREAMMAAVLALRHSISPDEAITKADQEAFAQRTAPTARTPAAGRMVTWLGLGLGLGLG